MLTRVSDNERKRRLARLKLEQLRSRRLALNWQDEQKDPELLPESNGEVVAEPSPAIEA